jgi:hypothetical protein
VRRRLIGLLAAGVTILGAATAGVPGASAASGATCTLVGVKVVGLRTHNYAVTVRMANLTSSTSRIRTTLADNDNKTYKMQVTVAANAAVNATKVFSAPVGTKFRVVACAQKSGAG